MANPPQESTSDSNPLPLESIPTHAGTPWPKAGKMSGNLFELRKDWPIPPTSTSNPPIKIEPQPQELTTPNAATAPKAEKWGWGSNCSNCKNMEEDWDGDHQKRLQRSIPSTQAQNAQQPQKKNLQKPQNSQQLQMPGFQCPQTQNYQKPQNFQCSQSQTFDIPERNSNQIRLHRELEEKMERLNKYSLDCFSDSELDSKSDVGKDYRYEHKYETLI